MTRQYATDKWLLSATALLVVFGALMIYSTTSVVSPRAAEGVSQFYYFKKHIFSDSHTNP